MRTQTVSIKVDAATAQRLAQLPNRSEFIRKAVWAALGVTCPLCRGTGESHSLQMIRKRSET